MDLIFNGDRVCRQRLCCVPSLEILGMVIFIVVTVVSRHDHGDDNYDDDLSGVNIEACGFPGACGPNQDNTLGLCL